MKQFELTFLLTVLMSMASIKALAYNINVKNADGVTIYYNYINDSKELEVSGSDSRYDRYRGDINIPEEVTYMNRTRRVTAIGESAFYSCNNMTSVIIPNSVTYIGNNAFRDCSVTSVTIPNSVTNIGENAFYQCSLTSVTIGSGVTSIGKDAFKNCNLEKVIVNDIAAWSNIEFANESANPLCSNREHLYSDEITEIKDLVIPNGVAYIGKYAFYGCNWLSSVIIPNSVTNIGENAFSNCIRLTSVIIPNSVTNIGENAFLYCRALTSITIPNSVINIGENAFSYCNGLTSVTIPNSVTNIGSKAFQHCSDLTSVTIPNSVTKIGDNAFYGCGLISVTIGSGMTSIGRYAFCCDNLATVESLIQEPFSIRSDVFSHNTKNNAILIVPKGTIDKYKAKDGWKDFVWMEESGGTNPTPETKKCATPTISYQNGELAFSCKTERAEFVSEISDGDIKKHYEANVKLTATYDITVFAMATGYLNSDTIQATLCWIDADPKTEGISSMGVATMRAKAVMIQSQDGVLTVDGVDNGQTVRVYDLSGVEVGSAMAAGNTVLISTRLRKGEAAIVAMGNKRVKVLIR